MNMDEALDKELLGVDLMASPDWDLGVAVHDLATQTGIQNVVNAFIRELTTPQGYIGRYVYDVEGLKLVDADYGNPAYYQLSEPLSELWINDMLTHIQGVAAVHPRLAVEGVDYNLVDLQANQVQFMIMFRVQDNVDPINLLLVRDGNVLSAGVVN